MWNLIIIIVWWYLIYYFELGYKYDLMLLKSNGVGKIKNKI